MGSFEMSDLLSYYAEANSFTRIDRLLDEIEPVSTDIDAVVRLVQGLLIHEALASFYGAAFPERRVAEKQLHGANAILERAKRLNASSLRNVRPPEERVVGVCRHFTTLFVGVLRSKGIPSRVRCGFATYFERGKHVDHWVGEYWHTRDRRWVLVDAQLDDFQRKLFGVQIDSLDVPRDRFLVVGDAWKACRNGADPQTFGVGGTEMWGLVEVFGNVFQDIAALQKIELLPWEWYGLAATDKSAAYKETDLVDQLASISSSADHGAIEALRRLVAIDERLRVPPEKLREIAETDLAFFTAN